MAFSDDLQAITWISPSGKTFILKTLESGFTQKHVGEVKENPRTSYSASSSTKGGGKGSKSSSSVSTSSGKKRVSDVNDTFTDLGVGGRDVALDCYFIGDNHYTQAENFMDALREIGKSQLKLAYGDYFTVNVLSLKLTNQLIQNINCS
ncbi:MAG: DNA circularization N-terminal domain-containing protein, partial [Bacteroidales bacterium]|nr:DNA circularization N-terminal domain-containing protein [Bacteroidales bacterium]